MPPTLLTAPDTLLTGHVQLFSRTVVHSNLLLSVLQNQLKAHRPFSSLADFKEFVWTRHRGDWEAAYEEFACFDDDAPTCCKDDFHTIEFEDDGEEVHDQDGPPDVHSDFLLYQVNPIFGNASKPIDVGVTDWAARSAERYTQQQIQSASRWREYVAKEAVRPEPVPVDPNELNNGQALIYRVVADHNRRSQSHPLQTQPLRVIVAGTAGSGKTT